jgi:predicted nucleotidyltransferase
MPRPPGNRRPLKATVIAALPKLRISLPMEEIARFCRRWSIARLEVFGSVLGDDFGPDSDLDFVATYAPQAQWSLLDRVRMKLELEAMLGRPVDLLNRRALERANSHGRAASILAQTQSLYVES